MTYDLTEYKHQKNDPYNPALCGIASFCIPGLGQTIAREPLRGLTFMAGELACLGIAAAASGSARLYYSSSDDGFHLGTFIFNTALISFFVIRISGVVDAVKVAKVNNLAYRDKKKDLSRNLHLEPFYFDGRYQNKNMAFGATLKVGF
jgi:hypothetical protein